MDSDMIQLLVLAAVALFLVLRLRNVLGTRGGFEKPDGGTPRPVPMPRAVTPVEGGPDPDILAHAEAESPTARALADIKAVEPDLTMASFMSGARAAYEMVVMGYETGDLPLLASLLSPEVLRGFTEAVEARRAQGLTVEASFIGVREAKLTEARFDPATRSAEITISFIGELHTVVRNAAGEVVDGDAEATRRQSDSFTFERIVGSSDPNWVVIATGN